MRNKITIPDQKEALQGTTKGQSGGFVRLKKFKTSQGTRFCFSIVKTIKIGNKIRQSTIAYLGSVNVAENYASRKSLIKLRQALYLKREIPDLDTGGLSWKKIIDEINDILNREEVHSIVLV